MGVALGLVVGKPLGIVGFSWVSIRLGLCMLPQGVTWAGMYVVGAAGGIGFTMAIFIGELAFSDAMLTVGKLGVLVGTIVASALALTAGVVLLPKRRPKEVGEITLSDAERKPVYWTKREGGE